MKNSKNVKKSKQPYAQRSDLDKIMAQWNKLSGLHSKEEWSAAVVRAATVAELAANFAIRRELRAKQLSAEFIDSLLMWANGLQGKLDKILWPLSKGEIKLHRMISTLKVSASEINNVRNDIIHRGAFCGKPKASETIEKSRTFVETLVGRYETNFKLVDKAQPTRE